MKKLREKLQYVKGKFNHYPNCDGCTRGGNCLTNFRCKHLPPPCEPTGLDY